MERIVIDGTAWSIDVDFLSSNWTCVWGSTCRGIGDTPDPSPYAGCCTLGAQFTDEGDAADVAAAAACCDLSEWANHAVAQEVSVFADTSRTATGVVDGACIFWNPPDFEGGAGCALHLAALRHGEPPRDWKPNVCWQLPFKVEDADGDNPTLRRWERTDFGTDGSDVAWLCTRDDGAFIGTARVVDAARDDLAELVGEVVADAVVTLLDTE